MKHSRYWLPLILLQVLSLFAAGQTEPTDSLWKVVHLNKRDMAEAKTLNLLAVNYARTDMARAKECLRQAIDIAEEGKLSIQLSNSYSQMMSICQDIGQLDSSMHYLSLLKDLSADNISTRSNYLQAAGLFYKRQGNLKAALPYMLDAMKMAAEAAKKDSSTVNRTALAGQTLNVGNTYLEMGEYREALFHHLQSLRMFEAVGNNRGISYCYQMIGEGFHLLHQLNEATDYTQRSLVLKTALNDQRGIATSLQQMGSIYKSANLADSAIYYYQRSLKINHDMGLKGEEGKVQLDMGNTYRDKKDLVSAIRCFEAGKILARQSGDSSRVATFEAALIAVHSAEQKQGVMEKRLMSSLNNSIETSDKGAELLSYQYLIEHYTNTGQMDKALGYTKKYYEQSDSLASLNVQLQLKKMEGQFNLTKKEEEIALLKKDQQLMHVRLEERKAIEYGGMILLLLLVLIGFLIINRYRIVQRSRRVIDMEKMRNHIARDLHDDVGSALTTINIMSNVALHEAGMHDTAVRTSLQKIKDRSSAIMERMDDIVWTINPHNDTMEQLVYRMKEFAGEILEPLNIRYTFEEDEYLSAVTLDARKRRDLYLLFKEAVNNAAKYSGCKNLLIRLRQGRDSLQLEITDDGKGFVEEGLKNGNGLKNMRDRAASMVGDLRIDSVVGKGTRIGLDLPIG